jgi:hypothetical protein
LSAEACGQSRKRFLFSSSRDNTVRVWSVEDSYACVVVVPLASGNVLHLVGESRRRLPWFVLWGLVLFPRQLTPTVAALPITSTVASESAGAVSDSLNGTPPNDVKMVVFAGCQNTKVQATVLSIPSSPPDVTTPAMSCPVHWSVHGGHYGFVYAVAVRTLPQLPQHVEV